MQLGAVARGGRGGGVVCGAPCLLKALVHSIKNGAQKLEQRWFELERRGRSDMHFDSILAPLPTVRCQRCQAIESSASALDAGPER
jgi:hypothetical protein